MSLPTHIDVKTLTRTYTYTDIREDTYMETQTHKNIYRDITQTQKTKEDKDIHTRHIHSHKTSKRQTERKRETQRHTWTHTLCQRTNNSLGYRQ